MIIQPEGSSYPRMFNTFLPFLKSCMISDPLNLMHAHAYPIQSDRVGMMRCADQCQLRTNVK